jgi:tRNA pseudouridine38-40 synthase
VTGASRTDAGVHALGQVASLVPGRSLDPAMVRAALNATLPRDVRVVAARSVPAGFDARRAARLKRYGYLVARGPVASPFLRGYAWHVARPLDVARMRAALRRLRGQHDFSAFQAAAGRDRPPVCTVRAVRVAERGGLVGIFLSADAFLHHMVRNVVGTLVEVGQGRRPPGWVAEVLAGRDRRQAGPTAPGHGLYLVSVRYPVPLFPGGGRHRGDRPRESGTPLPPGGWRRGG